MFAHSVCGRSGLNAHSPGPGYFLFCNMIKNCHTKMENNFYYVHLSHRLHIHYMQKYHCVHNALCANKHFLLNKEKQKQNEKRAAHWLQHTRGYRVLNRGQFLTVESFETIFHLQDFLVGQLSLCYANKCFKSEKQYINNTFHEL